MTPDASHGFRALRVVDKRPESRTITSFLLEPADADGWRDFDPGQFLAFRIPCDTQARGYVLRTYSVSSAPGQHGRYRISVKREEAPRPDLPDGVGSCHLHRSVHVGDVLMADGPRGDFTLDRTSPRPVVLLSGGVGLTPMVSMLHALAAGASRPVYFIHACDNGELHALGAEIDTLAKARSGITVHTVYRFPTEADVAARRHQSQGVVTRELMQRLLPLDDYDFYLCGPPPFMQAVYRTVRDLGVPRERIAYEFFGPASILDAEADAHAPTRPTAGAVVAAQAAAEATAASPAPESMQIEFRKTGRSATWNESAESLLSFAEDQGLSPEFSCRAGVCGTCSVALLEGEVDYFEEPLDDPGAGRVLICCSRPKGAVVLDL